MRFTEAAAKVEVVVVAEEETMKLPKTIGSQQRTTATTATAAASAGSKLAKLRMKNVLFLFLSCYCRFLLSSATAAAVGAGVWSVFLQKKREKEHQPKLAFKTRLFFFFGSQPQLSDSVKKSSSEWNLQQ